MDVHDTELERIIHSNTILIIDTCSLLEYAFEPFSKRVEPLLQSTGKKLILPVVVVHEIEKNAKKNQRLEINSKRALAILVDLKKKSLLDVVGDECEPKFGDVVFLSNVLKQFLITDVAVITQDNNLTHDLLSFNSLLSVQSRHHISVYRLSGADGYLIPRKNEC